MDSQELSTGPRSLDSLSQAEYRQSLADLLASDRPEVAAMKIGRLVGVILKEPFAESDPLDGPSKKSHAYRSWHFRGDAVFINSKSHTWQYKVLAEINRELGARKDVPDLCQDAYQEGGFFGYFARVLRKYICGDKETRKLVDKAIKAATKSGSKLPHLTPEAIVAAGGCALGAILVERIPMLGMVRAPVIGATVLILYTLGIDAFCQWSQYLDTADDEKK